MEVYVYITDCLTENEPIRVINLISHLLRAKIAISESPGAPAESELGTEGTVDLGSVPLGCVVHQEMGPKELRAKGGRRGRWIRMTDRSKTLRVTDSY